MPNYIHPITIEAATEVASNLRLEDYREVTEGHGLDPRVFLPMVAKEGSAVYFTVPDGKTAGLAGVGDGGAIWMLCTPEIHRTPSHLQEKPNGMSIAVKSLYCGT